MQVQIYPNPARSFATNSFTTLNQSSIGMYLANAEGKFIDVILFETTLNGGLHSYDLPVSKITPGNYFVVVTVDGEVGVRELVVL